MVTGALLIFLGTIAGVALLDALARPRGSRSVAGLALGATLATTSFGLFLALAGHAGLAAGLTLGVAALLALASNAKRAMLGEPLLFSDLALIGAVFKHPQFYLSAVKPWQQAAVIAIALALAVLLAVLFVARPLPHLAGLVLAAGGAALAWRGSTGWRGLSADAEADMRRHGLFAALLLHWRQWRATPDPAPCPAIPRATPAAPPELAPELVVMIQCESFADPVELFGDAALALPALATARGQAWRQGRLHVSGFGAYTMRSEYGVLFGREEEALGLRRFDPYLTAHREGSWALPARLRAHGWDSTFLHPHDLRFYSRDRILPAAGFTDLAGPDAFPAPLAAEGRYVTDAAMAQVILARAGAATRPSLLYAVTIENHGPWAHHGNLRDGYLHLLRHGDAMLQTLTDGLRRIGRPALLVFFGDHRPSIPGITQPGGERHTPYVVLRIDGTGQFVPGDTAPRDLTPAGLHHLVLDTVLGDPVTPA